MSHEILGNSSIIYNLGDVLVATEKVWCKDKGAYIRENTEITIKHMDDLIILPSPSKWKKIN